MFSKGAPLSVAPTVIGLLGCILLGWLLPPGTLAREAEVRGAARSTDLYNTELGATVLDGRLDVEVESGWFLLGGTWRGYHLSDKTYNPRDIEYPQPKIKHRYGEVRADSLAVGSLGTATDLALRVGDFFATYDRGLTLRSYEDIDLETDRALDGILGECRLGAFGLGNLRLSALSGKLKERISETKYNDHRVRGGRLVLSREGLFSLAASGLDREVRPGEDTLRVFDDAVLGGEAELWCGPLHLAGDYAYREGDYYAEPWLGEVPGHAGYLTGTASGDWFTLVGEYKDYHLFDNALVNPPTCVMEHPSTLMNRVTHEVDLSDERGFLVQGDLFAVEGLPLTGGASEARRDKGDLAHWEIFGNMGHAAGGLGEATLEASWSREYTEGKFTEYMTGVLETELAGLGGDEAVLPAEFGLGGQRVEEPSGETYENYLASVSWYAHPIVTISGAAETTTEADRDRDFWLYGEAGFTLPHGFDVSVGVGTERGGKKCSGGVCFTEPEFTGVRLRLLKTF